MKIILLRNDIDKILSSNKNIQFCDRNLFVTIKPNIKGDYVTIYIDQLGDKQNE